MPAPAEGRRTWGHGRAGVVIASALLVVLGLATGGIAGGVGAASGATPAAPTGSLAAPIDPAIDAGPGGGYWLAAADGGLFSFGDAIFYGSTAGITLTDPIVGMAAVADGGGYWEVSSDGGIFSFGDATFYGGTFNDPAAKPTVGMAATPDGHGYWLVGTDGGIFSFGDATFYGSTGALTLNQPIVGMAATPDGKGYWLVAADGGIFSFGDATFYGSTGGLTLNKPIVGMASTPDGHGYWLVASDGGIFAFGDAVFYGSTGGLTLNKPVVAMAPTLDGQGYYLVASDGGIFSYGDAFFYGSTGSLPLVKPIVGMAVVPSHAAPVTSSDLADVSCPSTSFCAAVDTGGNVMTYAGGRWSAPRNIDSTGSGGFASVSCPTTTFCMAVSDSQKAYSLYDGTSWSPLAQPPPTAHITSDFVSVSCANDEFCATVSGSSGRVAVYYPTYPVAADRWVQSTGENGAIGPTAGPRSISCAQSEFTAFCMNVSGGSYQTTTFPSGTPSPVAYVALTGTASVSCTSTTFCVDVGSQGGSAAVFNGTTFTTTGDILAPWNSPIGLTGVSCVATFCAAIDGSNIYSSVGGLSWTAGIPFDPARDGFGISCASPTFCAVIGRGGGAYTLNPALP